MTTERTARLLLVLASGELLLTALYAIQAVFDPFGWLLLVTLLLLGLSLLALGIVFWKHAQ